MRRLIVGLAATLAAAPLALAQTYHDSNGTVVSGVAPLVGCSPAGVCAGPASAANPLPVSGSLTATIGGYQPSAAATPLAVSTASSRVALPAGATVVVYNTGANPAYVAFGGVGVTASSAGDVVQPGAWAAFAPGAATYLAAVTTAGATTLNVSGGSGTPSGAGGGAAAGSTGADYSGNKPALPVVGANFAASGPFANYALAATLPLNFARKAWGFQNAAGVNCALVFDDGSAANGAAPVNATVYPIAPGAGAGQQGGSDGDPYFKGRVQAYCAAALTGNAFIALYER